MLSQTRKISAVLSRDLRIRLPTIESASGLYYYTSDVRKILDGCGGSAIACVGHSNDRVKASIVRQMNKVSYCHSQFFTTDAGEDLAAKIVQTTNNQMARLLTLSSGSEALEAALKLARQYFLELPTPQPDRVHFIARLPSYHGATLATLGLGGHVSRRSSFEPMLTSSIKASQCNEYRGPQEGETRQAYVDRLAKELDNLICSLPEKSVCGFVLEPVTGASTGSVPAAEGYLAAVKEICQKHGVLLILDEVMCGMGRTGVMHAWQHDGVVPNLQIIGKAFGGGYVPISGVLVDHEIDRVLSAGSGRFSHGQSFQCHPVASAAALEVQKIIEDDALLSNVREMGKRLADGLRREIGDHPNVGNIRGRGLFWSIEFVEDRATKTPLPASLNTGYALHEMALQEPHNLCVYPGRGTVDGHVGDHVLLAPAFTVTSTEIDLIVDKLAGVVRAFFVDRECATSCERQW